MFDTVLAADRIEEHLNGWMIEPNGKYLAVISQNLLRHNISGDRIPQALTHHASALSGRRQPSTYAHPGMIINTGEFLS
ncbi:Uncharacterised protein [Mycobacteroides abscessus subsp. abscessus]|nr:hypothetical protein MA4S0726RA_1582 [Mycobacteroides abscessus 4S-0726-RA]EIU00047.1 hypothetical protein MA4S0303_2047 [Mycobacteroides abscessus 4S-0303]EIU02542.1 hypothetical protein MA4S0726RB_1163 [Mycobacteroides abscessus 4S-0726-RB]EIV13405.1 hypothetical protein MA4S0206_0984 [Mycobacteroides abscessus 4S-0206]EIV51760.1 hypothetical protein MA4S0116R_1825 [Mycobacteroides abscessus 4S-0116-R]EIV66949.1 hypothetical protein MA4S0116S_0714 [Mycobacteroides abscessus 4S-0116-S]SHU